MKPKTAWKRMWLFNLMFLALFSGALLALVLFRLVDPAFAITFVAVLAAFGLIMYFRQRSNIKSRPDERIWRLGYRASWFSWHLTTFALLALWTLDHFGVKSLNPAQMLAVLIVGSYASFLGAFWILRGFGESGE